MQIPLVTVVVVVTLGGLLYATQPSEEVRLKTDIERLQGMRAELAADTRRAQMDCMADGADPQMASVREVCMEGLAAIAEANASAAAALQARIDKATARMQAR